MNPKDVQATAGPWFVKFGSGAYRILPSPDATRSIASVPLTTAPGQPLNPADAYHARLIAAAPELLAACKQAEQWLESWASAEPYLSIISNAILRATEK